MGARLLVHLVLLATFAASLATVTAMTEGWPHLVVGSAFVGLVVIHVAQRRHTAIRLLGNLARSATWLTRRGRLAWSDLILALLTLNVLMSGSWDLATGNQVILQPRSVGIPFRDIGWHVSAALLLLVYLCVHVGRRWGRIRHSVIR
jgi:predicted alpha/beta hydrolase